MSEIASPKREAEGRLVNAERRGADAEPRRADAARNIAAILDAAVDVLAERPEASMADIAAAAGVARQTVYAHYSSREALLAAVADRALAQAVAAIDDAEPQRGPPVEALDRLIRAWWGTVARHARVLDALATTFPAADAIHAHHAPILDRLDRLVRRGQRAGVFDRSLPPRWVTAAFLGLMHTAAEEVAAGRIDPEDARRGLERTVPRVFGALDDRRL
jgi:AcrR family transcriptional regulator